MLNQAEGQFKSQMRTKDHTTLSTGRGGKAVGWFKRSICLLVCAAIVNTSAIPLVQAKVQQRQQEAIKELMQPAPADRYVQGFDLLGQVLESYPIGIGLSPSNSRPSGAQYRDILAQMEQEARALKAEWQTLRSTWEEAHVSADILRHQAQIEAAFQAKHDELMGLLQAAAANPGNLASLQRLQSFYEQEHPRKTHLPVNLENMPWQVEQPKPEMPATSAEELEAKLHASDANASATAAQAKTVPPLSQATYRLVVDADQEAKEVAQASVAPRSGRIAKAGEPFSIKAATAATAADLAATIDAQQTEEIKALAASLGNNPHKIYQWVHDNIHYFPSHGSVQGAQDTLDKRRGNAFDTNSLLIALLRSAGIPARYVYGTVEIPVEQVQNWVGGTATASAAQQILAQGGVPNALVTKGGKDFAIRLEHVWVEALIEYQPGRGAKHIPGQSQPDAWVPMDGSFKQYTYSTGMDLQAAVPFDTQSLTAAAQQGAEINEAEGWVRGLNSAALESHLKTYQAQLESYINSQNGGNSTVGDVLGAKLARIDPLPYLAGTLPYTIKARSQQFSEIPNNRRAQFKYEIYTDQRSVAWGYSPLVSWQAPTASLAGKKVTIAWVAADEASQQAIEALIPTPPPGQELDPSKLPAGLSRSISLQPEIRLEGQTVATGPAFRAGDEPVGVGSFTRYGGIQWDSTLDQLIAGQQTALGISIQGISAKQLEALRARMEHTKATLEQAVTAPQSERGHLLSGLTGDHLTGDMLTATIWGYFASLQSYGVLAGSQAGVIDLPALQYGLLHAQVKPNKLYGIVTTGIGFQGLNMDVGHLRYIRWVKDDHPSSPINSDPALTQNGKRAAQNRWITYNKGQGQYASAMEHATLEEFWVDRSQCRHTDSNGQTQNPTMATCAEGISAVKAIAIAQSQGQKIYTINQSNRATALPKLTLGGDVGAEIRNAIQAGKEVVFHEHAINAHGWTGFGYIIVDPDTGAGAHMIEGRGNGGMLLGVVNGFGFSALITAWTFGMVGYLTLALAIIVAVSMITTALVLYMAENGADAAACYNTGLDNGIAAYAAVYAMLSSKFGNNGKKPEFIKTLITLIVAAVYKENKPEGAPAASCF